MPNDRQWDGLEFNSLNFPYNKVARKLAEDPLLVGGSNSFCTYGGTVIKRPGTMNIDNGVNTTLTKRIDRIWLYETLDTPPYVYIVASAYDSGAGTWGLYYIRMDAGGAAWTSAGTLRSINASTRPHEAVISRGLLYVKGYPSAGSGEKLGTVIFDGTGGTPSLTTWGLLGPSTPARINGVIHKLASAIGAGDTSISLDAYTSLPAAPFNIQIDYEVITVTAGSGPYTVLRGAQGTVAASHGANAPVIYRNWSASSHPIAVNTFWAYTYAYKTKTGHLSNRAPVETNPDNLPSQTGPFTNLLPSLVVQGLADTTNIPTIVIYRTTDGGGTFMELEEITNTGAGNITYVDKSLTSGAGQNDPQPDANLNTQSIAPGLNTNSPPPTVLSPKVTGTDTPVASTPFTSYQSRLWFAIGNVVFFSANEELNAGIPEESWPSGTFGNFYRFQYPVTHLMGTTDALYVITTHQVYQVTGSNLETFNPKPLLTNVGGAYGHPRAITQYGDTIVWLTNDLRVAILQGNNFRTISEPLGLDYVTLIKNNSAEMSIRYWAELEKEWIVLTAHCPTPTNNKVWVYDINKSVQVRQDFWNTPWTIIASAVASGRIRESDQQSRLLFFSWNGTSGSLTRITSNTTEYLGTDYYGGANTAFSFQIQTNLFRVPPGNHVNALRRPGLTPVIAFYALERTFYAGDTDPTTYYYLNDLWTTPLPAEVAVGPARDDDPIGYRTLIYQTNTKGNRIAIEVDKPANTELFEMQNLFIVWNADAGAGL